jgi:hypothetical protein
MRPVSAVAVSGAMASLISRWGIIETSYNAIDALKSAKWESCNQGQGSNPPMPVFRPADRQTKSHFGAYHML